MVGPLRTGGSLLLLFDYDGTLTPIVEHPSLAVLTASAHARLCGLSRCPGVRVGVVSGRSLSDLKPRVGVPEVDCFGTGGLEMEIGGAGAVHPEADKALPLLEGLYDRFAALSAAFPGAWVERKPFGLTVHYRAVPAERVEACRDFIDDVLRRYEEELRIVDAVKAVEISPDLRWSKGSVVRLLHSGMSPPAGVLFAGDSAGDTEALQAAASLGGLSIGVGPEAPNCVRRRLPDPAALGDFLDVLLERLVRLPQSAGGG